MTQFMLIRYTSACAYIYFIMYFDGKWRVYIFHYVLWWKMTRAQSYSIVDQYSGTKAFTLCVNLDTMCKDADVLLLGTTKFLQAFPITISTISTLVDHTLPPFRIKSTTSGSG